MPPRPASWRDVTPLNPARGARLNGYGLGAWRAVVPASAARRGGASSGDGRGQPNDLERTVAERALEKKEGFSLLNAGGRALMGALDVLDTSRAAVVSGLKEASDIGAGEGASLDDFIAQTRRNMTAGELLFGDDEELANAFSANIPVPFTDWAPKVGIGLAADIALDPLTYLTGATARVGAEAGQPAARALLKQEAKDYLGEAAARAAERSGHVFADDAARAAFVQREGATAASQAAQKAVQFRSNQALSQLEREAIGALPGTYVKAPLKFDKVVERIAPERVVTSTAGKPAVRLTRRELGAGRIAGKVRAKLTQGRVGNRMAQLFTKNPDLRKAMLFGSPEDAAKAILSVPELSERELQRRLFETTWGSRWIKLARRAKKAGINGEVLRYAFAEQLNGDVAGPNLARVMSAAAASSDEALVNDIKSFFPDIERAANSIDPENKWLMHRDDYTTRLPSDEMIAIRGGWGNAGGQLKKDAFDFRRMYGLDEDQTRVLFGEELLDPAEAGGRPVDQQIDDILEAHGQPNWFERDAYKAMPDYIRRMARRYGDEFLAKRLRDLGIAEASWVKQLSERGYSQARAKSFIHQMSVRANARANKKTRIARAERAQADLMAEPTAAARTAAEGAQAEVADVESQMAALRQQIDTQDSEAVREYESFLREESATLQVRRDALMDQVDLASEQKFLLDHAHVELAHKVNMETYRAYKNVTRLEAQQAKLRKELEGIYDTLNGLNAEGRPGRYRLHFTTGERVVHRMPSVEAVRENLTRAGFKPGDYVIEPLEEAVVAPPSAAVLREMEANEARIIEITNEMQRIEDVLQEFEDLAAMPTDQLEQQLVRVDEQLQRALADYDAGVRSGAPNADATNKINALAETKASILHEKGAIERARGRVADVDRTNPENLIAELDDLRNAEDMGDKYIHSQFPELPDEIHGSRLRSYFNDRLGEVQQQIDDTQGQVISAYSDRDTMRVTLAEIRAERREATRKLHTITKKTSVEDRAIAAQQEELLRQADEAATEALRIDWEETQLREQMGELAFEQVAAEYSARIAEGHLLFSHAMQLKYEARAAASEASAANARKVAQTWKQIGAANYGKPLEEVLVSALTAQYKAIGAVSMTQDKWLVDALRAATVMMGPEGIRPAMRVFDRVQNLWKAYALSTPGTVMRNLFGGVFNNWLAGGIRYEDYADYMKFITGQGRLSDADRAIFEQIQRSGLLVGSGTTLEIERRIGAGNLRPWSSDFKPLRFMRGRQENVESLLRGTLAYRTMKDGGDLNEAIARVMKYHFDYDDISAFERSVMRRIVPFYTWTRKNFPLMLEQMFQNPTKFTRFYQLKNELELYSPEEQIVPSYFGENLAVRLPFGIGGGQGYVLPDLPFTALNDVTDPSIAVSQVSPFIKTPLEYAFGEQFFKGIPLKDEYQPVWRPLGSIPGLMPALQAVGRARRGADGQWMMKQKDMYVMEQMMPSFGKARRLFPTENAYTERMLTAWLGFGFGLGLRSNTPESQRNEAFRRIDRELEWVDTQVELGYLVPGEDKLPRFGQTINAAYQQLGIEEPRA